MSGLVGCVSVEFVEAELFIVGHGQEDESWEARDEERAYPGIRAG
jgi:hypothetical protein